MKNLVTTSIMMLGIILGANAQFPNIGIPNLGKSVQRKAQNSDTDKKNAQAKQQSGYRPKTDEERDCESASSMLKTVGESFEKNIKKYEDAVNRFIETKGQDFIGSEDDDYLDDIERYNSILKTCEKYKCPGIKPEEVKKELAEKEKKAAAVNEKLKTGTEKIKSEEKAMLLIRDQMELIIKNERLYCCDDKISSYMVKSLLLSAKTWTDALIKMDLKNKMADYKKHFTNDDYLKLLDRFNAADDEEWRKYNDIIYKAVTDGHAAKKENLMVYLCSNAMVTLTEEIMKFNPNHGAFKHRYEAYKRFLSESKANITKMSAGTMLEQNMGKIVFSNTQIKPKQENPSTFKNNFTSKEFIYGMIYHPITASDVLLTDLYVYDEEGKKLDINIDYKEKTAEGHYAIYILVDPYNHAKEFGSSDQKYTSASKLDKLPYKNNKLRIVLEVDGIPVSEGTLTIDMNDGLGIIEEMYKKEEKMKYTFSTPPPVRVKDPAFEAQVMAYYNTTKPAGAKINRVISNSTEWIEHTKDVYVNGKVMTVKDYRSRDFTLVYTSAKGVCMYTFGDAQQKYINGAFGPTIWKYKTLGEDGGYDFPCQNINK